MKSMQREWYRGPQWRSESLRREWEPVLQRARTAWEELEVGSVTEGLRRSALVYLTPKELPRASRDCVANGLRLSVLTTSAAGGFRAAVHRPDLAPLWHAAWHGNDDDAIGKLLGFPDCCREFFRREWADGKSSDVTRVMPTVDGPWEANIMLRWLGVRLVPHLPCSGDCEETVHQARRYLEAGQKLKADVGAIESLLRLPVTHTALNGIAVVETPYFRFMANTDALPDATVSTRAGSPGREPCLCCKDPYCPGETHHHDAPLAQEEELLIVDKDGAVHGSETDNGFGSRLAMDRAHAVVLRAVGHVNSAIDLGCGDGTLLARIADGRGGRWWGIECDTGRATRGQDRYPELTFCDGRIECEGLLHQPYDVALLMPGRLLEMSGADAGNVRDALLMHAGRLVVYAYGDVLSKYNDGLKDLACAAGLKLISARKHGNNVEAAEAEVAR